MYRLCTNYVPRLRNSLLNQHLHFSHLHKEDDFIRRYMNYLRHNEFGLNHKPWHKPILFNDLSNINYWLQQWNLFYEFIYKKFQSYESCYFVIYEELVNPNYVEKILNNKFSLKDIIPLDQFEEFKEEKASQTPKKKKRGRPRKS